MSEVLQSDGQNLHVRFEVPCPPDVDGYDGEIYVTEYVKASGERYIHAHVGMYGDGCDLDRKDALMLAEWLTDWLARTEAK